MAMRGIELVQPYLQAAKDVIARETGSDVTVGRVTLKKPPASTDEISIIIGVTGQIQGVVMIATPISTSWPRARWPRWPT
jgi:CheY-specific phosphatase CheX